MNQPNIIMITADGLRWDALGCAGNRDVRTPNIDALAGHGMLFTNAFTPDAQCASGNHAFLTGAVPSALVPEASPETPEQSPLLLPERLRAAGYVTGAVGALDLHRERVAGVFDRVQALGCAGIEDTSQAWIADEGHAAPDDEHGAAAPLLSEASHPTTWTGDQAVRFAQAVQEPFFLWVSFPRPRWPLDPPVPWKHLYRPSRLQLPAGYSAAVSGADRALAAPRDLESHSLAAFRRILTAWYGSISHVDRQIGRLLATLTARGRSNNIFVITAGRGTYLGYRGLLHTAPGPLYEPVIRVPLIIGGAAGQRKGASDPALVSIGDIVPGLLETLQLDTADIPGGRSIAAQLRDEGIAHRRALVLRGSDGPAGVRTARYKWLGPESAGGESLFDLQADPLERHNLHGERQSLAIRKMLLASASGLIEPHA